jgi:hypothetical protein
VDGFSPRASRREWTAESRGVADCPVARRLSRNQTRNQEAERGEHREEVRQPQARLGRRRGILLSCCRQLHDQFSRATFDSSLFQELEI